MPVTLLDPEGVSGAASASLLSTGSNGRSGDVRLVRIATSSGATFGTTPSGWEKIHDSSVSGAGRVGVFARRIVDAGESNSSISFSASANFDRGAITCRGASTAGLTSLSPLSQQAQNTGTSVTAPSVATGSDGVLLLWFSAVLSSGASSVTLTDPSGVTRLLFVRTTSNAGSAMSMCSQVSPPNPSGARVATASATISAAARGSALWVPAAAVAAVGAGFLPFFGR